MLLVACGLVGGCATQRDVFHRVRYGDTLYRIGKAYGVAPDTIARANAISDPSRIEIGTELLIPGATRRVPVDIVTPQATDGNPVSRGEVPHGGLGWPVVGGTLSSGFGQRGQSVHDGIDISAPAGTPVLAAADGEVIYSDSLRGYGNVIILRHRGGYATVYAHNRTNDVRDGQRVRRGDVIGAVGDTGRTTGANLHFEVRKDNVARNPLHFLPSVEEVAAPRPAQGRGG